MPNLTLTPRCLTVDTGIKITIICPYLFIYKSLLKSLPAHFDIINRTLDRFQNRDFSAVAKYPGNRKRGHLSQKLTYGSDKSMGGTGDQ